MWAPGQPLHVVDMLHHPSHAGLRHARSNLVASSEICSKIHALPVLSPEPSMAR